MSDAQERWRMMWADVGGRHVDMKDSQGALIELMRRYDALSDSDRREIDPVLCEALDSGTEIERFDALAIIDRFEVVEALDQLRRLAARLQLENSAGGPFERAKVERIIGRLNEASGEP